MLDEKKHSTSRYRVIRLNEIGGEFTDISQSQMISVKNVVIRLHDVGREFTPPLYRKKCIVKSNASFHQAYCRGSTE